MSDINKINKIIDKLNEASENLQRENAQGRIYGVGTIVTYQGKKGVVTDLNKGSKDPAGSTVDIRLDNGKVIAKVKVSSSVLQFFRS